MTFVAVDERSEATFDDVIVVKPVGTICLKHPC